MKLPASERAYPDTIRRVKSNLGQPPSSHKIMLPFFHLPMKFVNFAK